MRGASLLHPYGARCAFLFKSAQRFGKSFEFLRKFDGKFFKMAILSYVALRFCLGAKRTPVARGDTGDRRLVFMVRWLVDDDRGGETDDAEEDEQ